MRSVWIIDDDEDIRDVLHFALKNEGFPVVTFASAQVAWEQMLKLKDEELPGIILVDLLMPMMKGTDFINKLRHAPRNEIRTLPVILSTAHEESTAEALPDDIVRMEKPLDLDQFIALAQESCG
jgi:CheY-like chemotaxis protein